jgi:hypothetical protein
MKKLVQQIGRRRFLKAVPAAVAAGVALPNTASPSQRGDGSAAPSQRGGGTPPRVDKAALKGAQQIAGLTFTDAEE